LATFDLAISISSFIKTPILFFERGL
jgi:hypothetical protein